MGPSSLVRGLLLGPRALGQKTGHPTRPTRRFAWLVPWHVSMALLMHRSVGDFTSLGLPQLPGRDWVAVNPGEPQAYDQRRHLSLWDVALSRVQQKLPSTFWEMLLQGHFYETTSRLDFLSSPLHSEPPNMGTCLI